MNAAGAMDQPKPASVDVDGFYFGGDDALALTSWNSLANVVVVVSGRFVHVDGHVEPFSEVHVPATNRTATTTRHARACGWLTDLSIVVTGATPQRGQTYVRVDVVRGLVSSGVVLSTLVQGYVTATKRLAYPGSVVEDSLAGAGALRSLTGTDPAAGVEVSETVPTGARWRLVSVEVTLVTDATVANRRIHLFVDDGTNVYFETHNNTAQTASTTIRHSFGAGVGLVVGDGVSAVAPLPVALLLGAGHRFRSSTSGIVAGDNFGAPQYAVEEYLEAI